MTTTQGVVTLNENVFEQILRLQNESKQVKAQKLKDLQENINRIFGNEIKTVERTQSRVEKIL